jgi:hypothetical protein
LELNRGRKRKKTGRKHARKSREIIPILYPGVFPFFPPGMGYSRIEPGLKLVCVFGVFRGYKKRELPRNKLFPLNQA